MPADPAVSTKPPSTSLTVSPEQTEKDQAASSATLREAINLYVGLNGTVDQSQARLLFFKGEGSGYPQAEMWVARLYDKGRCGVAMDSDKAWRIAKPFISKIRHLAEQGDAMSAFLLGAAFHDGLGIAQNIRDAVFWYRKAADFADPLAMGNLGHMYQNGLGVPGNMTIALNWFERAAAKNNALIINHMGFLAKNGLGGPTDNEKAATWFQKAADMGYDLAMANLGQMYEEGAGVSTDIGLASEWYNKAAALGNPQAMVLLGNLYDKGIIGGDTSPNQAVSWYTRACDLEYTPGCEAIDRNH